MIDSSKVRFTTLILTDSNTSILSPLRAIRESHISSQYVYEIDAGYDTLYPLVSKIIPSLKEEHWANLYKKKNNANSDMCGRHIEVQYRHIKYSGYILDISFCHADSAATVPHTIDTTHNCSSCSSPIQCTILPSVFVWCQVQSYKLNHPPFHLSSICKEYKQFHQNGHQ